MVKWLALKIDVNFVQLFTYETEKVKCDFFQEGHHICMRLWLELIIRQIWKFVSRTQTIQKRYSHKKSQDISKRVYQYLLVFFSVLLFSFTPIYIDLWSSVILQCFRSGSLSHGSRSDQNKIMDPDPTWSKYPDPDPSDIFLFFKKNSYTEWTLVFLYQI